jgi:hypothetical protein
MQVAKVTKPLFGGEKNNTVKVAGVAYLLLVNLNNIKGKDSKG